MKLITNLSNFTLTELYHMQSHDLQKWDSWFHLNKGWGLYSGDEEEDEETLNELDKEDLLEDFAIKLDEFCGLILRKPAIELLEIVGLTENGINVTFNKSEIYTLKEFLDKY